MELRVLHYFLTIAKEENITRAAALLHIAQPSLSRQLQALEEELQVQLFDRSGRHLRLTEDGRLLKRHAQDILDLAEKAKQDLIGSKHALTGCIRIGGGEIKNIEALSQWMADFQKLYPQIQFQFESETSDIVLEHLENGLLDIGILIEPVDIEKYDILRMPLEERYGLLLPSLHPLAAKKKLRPEDLLELPLILPARLSAQSFVRSWFGEYYTRIQIACISNLWLNSATMVQQGVGACVTCDLFNETMLSSAGLTFVPFAELPEVGAVLAWKKQVLSRAAKAFLDFCQQRENSEITA